MVSAEALARLDRLVALVEEENSRQNLISRATVSAIWSRHVLDSVQLLAFAPTGWQRWIDVGSGGGFPGLAVACTVDRSVRLVEPRSLRATFLISAARKLDLDHVTVDRQRVEQLAAVGDVISARAVAPAAKVLQLTAHCATADTIWLLPRGNVESGELAGLRAQFRAMTFHVEHSLSDPTSSIIVGKGVPT